MTINIEQLIENLSTIFNKWNVKNPDSDIADAKKRQINLILPYVQLASFINQIHPNKITPKILADFAQDYQTFYNTSLNLGKSDFSQEVFENIKKIESGNKADLSKVELALKIIKEADKKYFHAHSRIAFNFGELIRQVTNNKLPQIKTDHEDIIQDIWQNFLDCQLEQNADRISDIDNLEEHALLNQISSFNQNIAYTLKSIRDSQSLSKTLEIFDNFDLQKTDNKTRKSIKKEHDLDCENIDITAIKKNELNLTYGIEKEFVLILLEVENLRDLESSPYLINSKLKESLADISARNLMQKKYQKEETIPTISDQSKYYLTFQDLQEYHSNNPKILEKLQQNHNQFAIDNKDYLAIKNDLTKRLLNNQSKEKINEIAKNFTRVEAFFYKLLFLNGNKPYDFKIEIDNVFDPKKSDQENFQQAYNLINKGRFHEKLFDMIQANEISLGVFNFCAKESLNKVEEAYKFLKFTANDTGLSIENPNAQVNFSINYKNQNLLLVNQEIDNNGNIVKLSYNLLAVEFLKILQNSLVEIGQKTDLFRDQDQVSVRFDLKKVIGQKLKNSNYHSWLNPSESAFTQHKKLAAKTATIRTSLFSEDAGVAEVRMIGNNPHFAIDYDQARILDHSFEYITKDLIEKVAINFNKFLENKTEQDLKNLLNQSEEIGYQGSVAEIPPLKIEDIIRRNTINNSQPFSQTSVRDSVALSNPKQSFIYRYL